MRERQESYHVTLEEFHSLRDQWLDILGIQKPNQVEDTTYEEVEDEVLLLP